MVEPIALLAFAAAVFVLALFMGIAQPIWCIIDCAIDDRRSTTSKIVWIILLVLLWGLTNWFYGALAAAGSVLRRITRIAWLAAILLVIGFFLLPQSIRSDLKKKVATEREESTYVAAPRPAADSRNEVAAKARGIDQLGAKAPPAEALPDLRIERIVPALAGSGTSGRWFNVTVVNKGLAATPAPVEFRARAFVDSAVGAPGTPLLVLTCAVADIVALPSPEPACPRASVDALAPGQRKTISMYVQGLAPRSDNATYRVELAVNPCKGAFAFGLDDLPNCQVAESDTTNNVAKFDSALFNTARRDNIK